MKKKDLILDILQNAAEGLPEGAIFERAGDSSMSIRFIIRKLLQDGTISRVGKGGQKDPFIYHAKTNVLHEQD